VRIAAALMLLSSVAWADVDKPGAAKLFEEGRAELAAGHPDAACKKFEQSLRMDPRAVGTLLNLALCNERQGKVASALALFIEAYDRANEADAVEQRKAAEEHIATLRPQVPMLVLSRAADPPQGAKLVIDDRVIALDEREVPIDPGTHDVTYTAPGRLPFETTLKASVSERVKLALPELQIPKPGLVRESWRRTYGKPATIGGGALVALSVGGLVFAKHRYNKQFDSGHCGGRPQIDGHEVCDEIGKNGVDSARTIGTTASVVGIIGLVTAAAGAYLWFSAPDEVVVTPTANGLTVSGRF
jgi:hypothetical protein